MINIFVKDVRGQWYEIDENLLKDKQVDKEKSLEAIANERAEMRKKVIDMLSTLNPDELAILKDQLVGSSTLSSGERSRQMISKPGDCDCQHCFCYCSHCTICDCGGATKR